MVNTTFVALLEEVCHAVVAEWEIGRAGEREIM